MQKKHERVARHMNEARGDRTDKLVPGSTLAALIGAGQGIRKIFFCVWQWGVTKSHQHQSHVLVGPHFAFDCHYWQRS